MTVSTVYYYTESTENALKTCHTRANMGLCWLEYLSVSTVYCAKSNIYYKSI